MEYLFDKWPAIKEKLKGNDIYLFLDFDGTLAPIADTPEKAFLPEEIKNILDELAISKAKVVIISGRALTDIKNKVGISNIIYVGNHGLEIEGPGIKFVNAQALLQKDSLQTIKIELEKNLSAFTGVFVEDKGLSLAVHFRLAEKDKIKQIEKVFYETMINYLVGREIRIKEGKMVLEVMVPADLDKGKAAAWLLTVNQAFSLKKESLPIYIGDDVTDEDAFRLFKNKGLTVFVGRPDKRFSAEYYLKDVPDVGIFLNNLKEEIQ